jgi:hypothetical protein
VDNKLGMYHLVFLSHMAFNILEYAKSQLVRQLNTVTKMPLFLKLLRFAPLIWCITTCLTLVLHVCCLTSPALSPFTGVDERLSLQELL